MAYKFHAMAFKCTVKHVLSSHTREAQNVAAEGRWLLNRGEYQYKINVWEHFLAASNRLVA